jgi:ATP-dependent Clp protease ATP-binding subunit ClpC
LGPIDKFDDRAKRVLALAQDEAIRFNHNFIGPEHVLLGLVREGEGVAAQVLNAVGLDPWIVRAQVEKTFGRGEPGTGTEITLHPRTKKLIELAVGEAEKLGHRSVGTGHVLLGYVREIELDGPVVDLLGPLKVTPEQVRQRTLAALAPPAPQQPTST